MKILKEDTGMSQEGERRRGVSPAPHRMSTFNLIFCVARFCASLLRPIVPREPRPELSVVCLARVTALPWSLSLPNNTTHIIIQREGRQ